MRKLFSQRKFFSQLLRDSRGTTAIEFAIVAPIFIALIIGIVYLCMGLFVVGSMHYAVEAGARCASVRTTQCSDSASTISYTQAHYSGPTSPPTFTYNAAAACGHSVSGSLDYVMDLGLRQITIPITATACFP